MEQSFKFSRELAELIGGVVKYVEETEELKRAELEAAEGGTEEESN